MEWLSKNARIDDYSVAWIAFIKGLIIGSLITYYIKLIILMIIRIIIAISLLFFSTIINATKSENFEKLEQCLLIFIKSS